MSKYTERTTMALHVMIREMYIKNIELARITKCSTQLILAGTSPNSIPSNILSRLIDSQNSDGGFVSNVDTIWNIKFLSYYPKTERIRTKAINWFDAHRPGFGFGRSNRDIGRIPVTGLAFYLIPEICSNHKSLNWLEKLWKSEIYSLTYKAAYTLMAFSANKYQPQDSNLIIDTVHWIESQQEESGGFAPWKQHPVQENIYCTAVACLGLLSYPKLCDWNVLNKAYDYMISTQLKNGIWRYHEIEDGAAWALRAMSEYERIKEVL